MTNDNDVSPELHAAFMIFMYCTTYLGSLTRWKRSVRDATGSPFGRRRPEHDQHSRQEY
jgi:hypothetical protein